MQDEAKEFQSEQQAKDRERKKAARAKPTQITENRPAHRPRPAYVMQTGGRRYSGRSLGGLLLLALALIPLERRLSRTSKV
jgi:hypothetical protein